MLRALPGQAIPIEICNTILVAYFYKLWQAFILSYAFQFTPLSVLAD